MTGDCSVSAPATSWVLQNGRYHCSGHIRLVGHEWHPMHMRCQIEGTIGRFMSFADSLRFWTRREKVLHSWR